MEKLVKLSAIRVANQLDMKGIKGLLNVRTVAESSSELFYNLGSDKYQCYFNYGVVVFSGQSEEEINSSVEKVHTHLKNPEPWIREDHEIGVAPGSDLRFDFDQLTVDHIDDKSIRIIMFSLAQSIALDHYNGISENLLTEIRKFTDDLESTGKLSLNRRNMMKFIGRALNTQNEVADNIYVFDAPEQVWDSEYLDALHKGLVKHFDLKVRVSEIEYTLRIIQDNLRVFLQISNQRMSNVLEWIIIILILVEVFDLILKQLF